MTDGSLETSLPGEITDHPETLTMAIPHALPGDGIDVYLLTCTP